MLAFVQVGSSKEIFLNLRTDIYLDFVTIARTIISVHCAVISLINPYNSTTLTGLCCLVGHMSTTNILSGRFATFSM